MPTIFSHTAIPVTAALIMGRRAIPRRLLFAGVIASIAPDADVLAFQFGIPYEDAFGHRGFSHSLLFAALLGLAGAAGHRLLGSGALRSFLFIAVAAASHGVLDAFTSGGMGIAFLWPFSPKRFFAPYRPIAVSPIGADGFFTVRGLQVLVSEGRWIWLPCAVLAISTGLMRLVFRRRTNP